VGWVSECSAIWDSRDDGDMKVNLRAIALYSGSIAPKAGGRR
jgi:hypothetical protein